MWKVIDGSDGEYEASSDGEIRNAKTKHILKQFKGKDGYMRTQIAGKINKTVTVHRIIAMTFIEPIEGKEFVNHKDGNKSNNCVENLEWVTNQENRNHALINGLHLCGDKCSYSKLSSKQVLEILELIRDNEYTIKEIAEKFNVSRATITDIKLNRTWKQLKRYAELS